MSTTRRNKSYRDGDEKPIGDSSTVGRVVSPHPHSYEKKPKDGTDGRATRQVFFRRRRLVVWVVITASFVYAISTIFMIEVGLSTKDPSLGQVPSHILLPRKTLSTKIKEPDIRQKSGNDNIKVVAKLSDKQKKKAKEKANKSVDGIGNTNNTEKPLEIHMEFENPPIFEAPIINPNTKDFDPNINGVVVTKIQGPPHLRALKQMLCLFTKAYNKRVNHDIIVFTSETISQDNITDLEKIVYPAKLTVEIDNPGLHKMVNDLSPSRKKTLLDRCNVTSTSDLSWYSSCREEASYKTLTDERIAYGWQAEFRVLWLWTHRLLAPYKYMMWMDSDAFCTRTWKQDPFATIERHDLALLFDHFPMGKARGYEFPRKTKEVFDRVICEVSLKNGSLVARDGKCENRKKSVINLVHGFFHVSSLDFYRSDIVMKWNRALIGDRKFSRQLDDQAGITIPAAVLAGNRSRDMQSLGVYTRVFHNYALDGFMKDWRGYFTKWWETNANTTFPEASGQCVVDISS